MASSSRVQGPVKTRGTVQFGSWATRKGHVPGSMAAGGHPGTGFMSQHQHVCFFLQTHPVVSVESHALRRAFRTETGSAALPPACPPAPLHSQHCSWLSAHPAARLPPRGRLCEGRNPVCLVPHWPSPGICVHACPVPSSTAERARGLRRAGGPRGAARASQLSLFGFHEVNTRRCHNMCGI